MQLKWSIRVLFALLMFFLNDVAAAQTLKIPYVSISGFQAPLYLGERAGLFKKNQLEAAYLHARRLIDRANPALERGWGRQPRAAVRGRRMGQGRRAVAGRRRHRASAQRPHG